MRQRFSVNKLDLTPDDQNHGLPVIGLRMIVKANSVGSAPSSGVPSNMRCPNCGQLGTFESLAPNSSDFIIDNGFRVGERRCPNLNCRTMLFVMWQQNQITRSYPALRVDFDKTKIPKPIVSAVQEAITCHANECFIAAGIMVRKTLEEMCRERGAQG